MQSTDIASCEQPQPGQEAGTRMVGIVLLIAIAVGALLLLAAGGALVSMGGGL